MPVREVRAGQRGVGRVPMLEAAAAAAQASHPEGLAGAALPPVGEEGQEQRRLVYRRRDILRYAPAAVLRRLWVQLSVLLAMFLSCAALFYYFRGPLGNPTMDALGALLGAVSTITTIGIYAPANLILLPDWAKGAFIVIFLVSVGAAASIVQTVLTQAVNRDLWTEDVLRREVAKMKDHVVVMGYSFLGRYVADKLRDMDVPFVVVVRDNQDLVKLREQGVPAFSSPVTEFHRALEDVGVRRASTMICTFNEDPDNLMAVLYANKVHPQLRIITIVHDRELVPSAKMAGADVVFPMANILGDLLGLTAVSREVAGVILSAKIPGRYLAEFEIPKGKAITFGRLNALAPVLLVLQDGKTFSNPPDDFAIHGGSTAFMLTSTEGLHRIRRELGSGPVSTSLEPHEHTESSARP
ncbi:MAG: NAD-binding protein [Euryarchaeota archaeon]|nr:NAD-binding protein [Euryarchaeota archaeon]MDE1836987.1 NAD-binding protein [Euryarchaeota archaeon]MDE1881570.1 NAD-binding protein [Euryarchaeota archaeon]MDE2046363.1 NAD-binding protein [Thermoplasmata archaeon]